MNFITDQQLRFFHYLRDKEVTCTQASQALGIPQKNLTWAKRRFEQEGTLWETKLVKCPITGYDAWLITTDPRRKPKTNQTVLEFPGFDYL